MTAWKRDELNLAEDSNGVVRMRARRRTQAPSVWGIQHRDPNGKLHQLIEGPDAHCASVEPEVMFETAPYMVRLQRAVCAECPLLTPCREYALAHGVSGFWGGLTEGERAKKGAPRRIGAGPWLKS